MSYVEVFGGTVIYPSDVSYSSISLTADLTLDWPLETTPALTVVARIMDITPASAGLSVIMPDATQASPGQTVLFNNLGPHVVTIKSSTGSTLVSLAAGELWQLYLIDSSTPTGSWRTFRYGAATAQAQASSLAGSGLVAIGATLAQAYTVAEYTSSRVLAATDRAQTALWSGGLGTFTLPVAVSVGNNWFVNVRNGGTGDLTLQPSGADEINGDTALALSPGDSAVVCCDGTNFYTIGLGQQSVFAFDYTSINLAGLSGTYTLAGSELNRIAYTFTGVLTGDIVIVAPATVQQYWLDNATTGAAYTLSVKTAVQVTPLLVPRNQRGIYYSNGTDIVKADTTSGVSIPIAVVEGGTGATVPSAARANLGSTAVGDAVFTAASAAAAAAAVNAVNKAGDTMTGALRAGITFAGGPTYPFQMENDGTSGVTSVGVSFGQLGVSKASIVADVFGDGAMKFYNNNNTLKMTITATGGLGLGVTDPAVGSISNTAPLAAGVFKTLSGNAIAISGVTQGLVTIPNIGNNGTYIVSCGLSAADPTLYSAVSLALSDNNVLRLVPIATAAGMTITNTGNQINATQTSGGNSTIFYTLTRLS